MIIAINYADQGFRKAQKLNTKTAIQYGADRVIEYTPEDIDETFRTKNQLILSASKGGGFYLWKPYFLYRAYQEMKEGDYVIYTDSGSIYVDKIQLLIDCMEKEQVDLMVFSLETAMLEKKYTKRDALILMGCDEPKYRETPQSIGGYVVMKKTPFVEKFLQEDLAYAQDIRIISEQPNTLGQENDVAFVAHRHDQSVWSLMTKKYHLKRFRDPSQFGLVNQYEADVKQRSTYPQIIDSHRMNVGSIGMLKWRRSACGSFVTKVMKKVGIQV